MRVVKIALRVVKIVIIALLALLLACNLYALAARAITGEHPDLVGWSAAVVVSGSMSPAIEVDDMIIIHRKDSYSCGDIITYKDGGSLVTHRIHEIAEDGSYITKGDYNNTFDAPVAPDSVVGSVILVIPKIGLIVSALRTPLGICVMLLIGFLLIEYPFLADKLRAKFNGGHHGGHSEK